jgi:hypothetical protein
VANEDPGNTETAHITELVGLFREALPALLPVMDKAQIEWRDGRTYDPWENIERTLYDSILGSCVENAVPIGSTLQLANYGLVRPTYSDRSFLVASEIGNAAFLELATRSQPFDEAVFLELRPDLTPSDNRIRRPLHDLQFLIAIPDESGRVALHRRITFLA